MVFTRIDNMRGADSLPSSQWTPGADMTERERLILDEVDKTMVKSAIRTLTEARRIRGDADLMARIRYHIRDQRDELAGLLDELGV